MTEKSNQELESAEVSDEMLETVAGGNGAIETVRAQWMVEQQMNAIRQAQAEARRNRG
jgi:hypothetical protein